MISNYDVLRRPILSEKSSNLKDFSRKVTLEVAYKASKKQIKFAAEKLFGIEVESVNTARCRGKVKRLGKSMGKQANFKKAVLTLSDSSDLEVFGSFSQPELPPEQQEPAQVTN